MSILTLQPDGATGIDTALDSLAPNTNKATRSTLGLRGYPGTIEYSVLKFDLSSLVGKVIISADFSLFGSGFSYGCPFFVNRILAANSGWTENATWNYADGSSIRWAGDTGADGGSDAGCSVVDVDYAGVALGSGVYYETAGVECVTGLDVTEFTSMVANNYGFILRRGNTGAVEAQPCSSDHATAARRPKLVVEYIDNTDIQVGGLYGIVDVELSDEPDETTERHAVQWRAFVGPPFRPDTAADFWDWSQINDGEVYWPTPDTVLDENLVAGAGTAWLYSPAGFPAAGGCWIGPRDIYTGTWEYITYTALTPVGDLATLTGLTRETVDTEQTGQHDGGSLARFWWPLTTNDGQLTLEETLDEALAMLSWQTRIKGFTLPQAALRNGHCVLVQARYVLGTGQTWGSWRNFLLGWLQTPKARQDATTEVSWEVNVVSLAQMLASIEARGLRVGPVNSASSGQISGSLETSAWYKLVYTGEFVGSNVALAPAQAVDSQPLTLYASERYLGAANVPNPAQCEIDQLHITAYVGQGKGYRWFQVLFDVVTRLPNDFRFVNQLGYTPVIGTEDTSPKTGHLIVFCENAAFFRAENPDSDVVVYEVTDANYAMGFVDGDVGCAIMASAGAYTVADWWDSLAPAGGALYYFANFGGTERFRGGLLWGDVDPEDVEDAWGSYAYNSSPVNRDANVAAPGVGQTMRRQWSVDSTTAAAWLVTDVSTPGQNISGDQRLHLLLGCNGMGLTLTDAIAASAPGADDTLYISLGTAPCVDGLAASGTLQIGAEQITYSAKTTDNAGVVVTARGVNGTSAAHVAGETIYQVESGVATDALPLAAVLLERPAGKPALKAFKLYGSQNLQQPRVPDIGVPSDPAEDLTWSSDYTLLATVTNNALATYTYTHSTTPTRYRWFLLVVTAMTTDPYPCMLNEFKVQVASSVYSEASYLATGTIYQAAQAILRGVGIPDGAIIDGSGTPTVLDYTTAPDPVQGILTDLADMTGCFIDVGRDSKLTILPHPYFGANLVTQALWSKTTAQSYAPDWSWGRGVSQVELPWVALDGSVSGSARYPAVPDGFGQVVRFDIVRVADAAAAATLAEKRYWLARLPFGAVVEAAGAPIAVRPGVAQGLTWQLAAEMLPLARTYLLDQVTHRIADAGVTTVVHGVQLSREDER